MLSTEDVQDDLLFAAVIIFLAAVIYAIGFVNGDAKGKDLACESVGLKYIQEKHKCMKVIIED